MSKPESPIEEIVTAFYKKATTDVLIGHHFRSIQEYSADDPLAPPIEAFSRHIPRICAFWRQQLTGKTAPPLKPPVDLVQTHKALGIRRGELGRWMRLFETTLDEAEQKWGQGRLFTDWRQKLNHFERVFLASKTLFSL